MYFIADLSLNLYTSENKLFFAFSTSSLIEYVSITPSFISRVGLVKSNKIIKFTRIFRFLCAFRLEKFLARRSWEGIYK